MTKGELLALADRVERDGPMFALDEAVQNLIYPQYDFRGGELRMRLTSSLDDAVTLYPVRPKTIPSDPSKVCADALRARAALMKEEGE